MQRELGAVLTCLVMAMLTTTAPVKAAGAVRMEYAVIRGGDEIGRHVVDVDRQGDVTQVKISTNVQVKMAFITVYRFEQSSAERWKGNQLVALRSDTNDNGSIHHLLVNEAGNRLRVTADGRSANVEKSVLPASLWFGDTTRQRVLLNTVKGNKMRVGVIDLGSDTVRARHQRITAHHYRLTGELERDLWYDNGGTLLKLQMKGSDGSSVAYELR